MHGMRLFMIQDLKKRIEARAVTLNQKLRSQEDLEIEKNSQLHW